MTANGSFDTVFARLRAIMLPYGERLDCTNDETGDYHVNTTHIMKNKKPLFFGAVQVRKNYVSYHLMPVYVFPELLDGISPDLKKRMQGKSCFNFKDEDAGLFDELESLTRAGFKRYRDSGYI